MNNQNETPFDQNVTFSRFLIEAHRDKNPLPTDLRFLLEVVARACKSISNAVNQGALGGILGQ